MTAEVNTREIVNGTYENPKTSFTGTYDTKTNRLQLLLRNENLLMLSFCEYHYNFSKKLIRIKICKNFIFA